MPVAKNKREQGLETRRRARDEGHVNAPNVCRHWAFRSSISRVWQRFGSAFGLFYSCNRPHAVILVP